MEYRIDTAELKQHVKKLRVGDRVFLSGRVYTSRDAAHGRICRALDSGAPLPYALAGAVIYYAGPTPAPQGLAVGACGPTTSGRMDIYTPRLLDLGVLAMIGKGERSRAVVEAIVRNGAVYFCAIGGAGALAAMCIRQCRVIAYDDLGCESVKELQFENFPLTVGIDCTGGDIFERDEK